MEDVGVRGYIIYPNRGREGVVGLCGGGGGGGSSYWMR